MFLDLKFDVKTVISSKMIYIFTAIPVVSQALFKQAWLVKKIQIVHGKCRVIKTILKKKKMEDLLYMIGRIINLRIIKL